MDSDMAEAVVEGPPEILSHEVADSDVPVIEGGEEQVNGLVGDGMVSYDAEVQGDPAASSLLEEEMQEKVEEPEKPPPPTEEERLWSVVKSNPADFASWVLLIQETEKLGGAENISKVETVYDAFLLEFPLCYGYWKKYADHEARVGNTSKIVEVYERAVKAVTYSVDIWMHYSVYLAEKSDDMEEVRRLFERGIEHVGTDYLAHNLWDKYVEYETKHEEWSRVAQLYKRVLHVPLIQLDRYYASFKMFVAGRSLPELWTAEESAEAAAAMEPAPPANDIQDGPPGAEESKASPLSEAEQLEKYIAVRDAIYKETKEKDAKIRGYESMIRRPYFHVKPLDEAQLNNWHSYLDYQEKEGDFEKTKKLYERCLIACANYHEYWIRYAQFLESAGHLQDALDALSRATGTFVKRRPEIHLFAARIKEHIGDVSGSRSEYQLLNDELSPGLLESIIKHANMERRQGDLDAAAAVYESAIDAEKDKEGSKSLVFLTLSYARFLDQVKGDLEKAREVYDLALGKCLSSRLLMEGFLAFEASHAGVERVQAVVGNVIIGKVDGAGSLSSSDREAISSLYLQFLELFGSIESLRKAEASHSALFPKRKQVTESKKRPAPDNSASDRSKVQKTVSSSPVAQAPAQAASGVQNYTNGQGQWGGGYQTPYGGPPAQGGWQGPPVQQAPPQQWGAGYGAQAGYYDGYGYGPQQPPAQYAAYGQGYAQPTGWTGW